MPAITSQNEPSPSQATFRFQDQCPVPNAKGRMPLERNCIQHSVKDMTLCIFDRLGMVTSFYTKLGFNTVVVLFSLRKAKVDVNTAVLEHNIGL
jgi:hypothetical protein